MKKKPITTVAETEREFTRIFSGLSQKYSAWNVWQDFVSMTAASIANAVDRRTGVWHRREKEYLAIVKTYTKEEREAIVELFVLTVLALEANHAQDFLGKLYMELGLTNHGRGQFFTPWSVSDLMARLTIGDGLKERIQSGGYIPMNDPACGAGCMMIAFANVCREEDVNYQRSVLFVGQDIDPVAAKMAYIQLSLIGCPGYVVVGDTLTEPVGGTTLNPVYRRPESVWFTPFYFSEPWAVRRAAEELGRILSSDAGKSPKVARKPLPMPQIRQFLKEKNR